MNLWVNFGLKFIPFYKGKMAKISPKINKIKIWPKLRPKVINSCLGILDPPPLYLGNIPKMPFFLVASLIVKEKSI